MKHIYLSILAFFVLVVQGAAQVKITEVMYNPRSSEDNWEWVELHNPTSSTISLNGFVIDDENSIFQSASNVANASISAGGTVVLYNADDISAADFQAAWGSNITAVAVSNWSNMALGNGGDHVGVWSNYTDFQADTNSDGSRAFNMAISHVDYDDDGTIWPSDDGNGSIYLKEVGDDVSLPANWALSGSVDGLSFTSSNAGGNSGQDVASPGAVPSSSTSSNFMLQLLHYADVDGSEEIALDVVDEFSGVVDGLKKDALYGANSLLVTSGDIIIPGPRFYAAENNTIRGLTGSNEPGHLDVFFANQMGVQASAIGNHELDAGPGEFWDAAFRTESRNGITFPGSDFPWLAANIDFSQDWDFDGTMGKDGENVTNLKSRTANYAIALVNGDTVGLVGASTPTLSSITTTGNLGVSPSGNWTNQDLANIVQASVDSLKSMGVNKIILLSHMQQIAVEKSLAGLLDGVDIIVAGGSNTRMGDSNDKLFSNSLASDPSFDENYPYLTTDKSGDPVAVVNVDGDYKYLGRLVVEFDADGKINTNSIDENVSGVYAATAANVSAVGGTINARLTEVRDSVLSVINKQYQNIVGYSSVYLDGRRSQVRTQETNLGNLTADANLWYANQLNPANDSAVLVSIKNGGGIRTEIGTSKLPAGSNDPDDLQFFPPVNNAVTEGHLRATLRFNNGLVRLSLTAQELKDVIEHALSEYAPGVTDGGFPQIGGMRITYNPLATPSQTAELTSSNGQDSIVVTVPGERVREMVIVRANGSEMIIVENGQLAVDANMPINVVTLNFLANGGDGYPFTIANLTNRRMNYYDGTGFGDPGDFPDGVLTNDPGMSSDISSTGGEQDALAEYMMATFPNTNPFDLSETDNEEDKRIVRTLRVLEEDAPSFTDVLDVALLGAFQVPGDVFDESAAEIPAYDTKREQVFFTDANSNAVHVLDVSDPTSPTLTQTISLSGGPNSVAVYGDIVAVAVEADPKQDPGKVEFFDADNFSKLGEVTVGALPDMVIFNEDGTKVLTANEGEPSDDYLTDPEGSISIITLKSGNISSSTVTTADFTAFNSNVPAGVRIFGRSVAGEGDKADGHPTTVAQDMEPEYITIQGNTAYVTCQENNALAVVDIDNSTVTAVLPLGTVDHNVPGNGLDASNKDDGIFISQWPVKGMFLPDAISSFKIGGTTYLITANEGDAREYEYESGGDDVLAFADETRVKDLDLDETAFPFANLLQQDDQLGRIKTTLVDGDTDGDGDHDEIYTYGTRSFTIWNAGTGAVVWDSKNALEMITKQRIPNNFNATNDENNFDNRSDDKGPEPEGVTVGEVNGDLYAFVGLERVGGIVVYNITNPTNPTFARYINTRDYTGDPEAGTSGNLAPEGLAFVSAEESPNDKALLIVTYEVSGSVAIFEMGDAVVNAVDETKKDLLGVRVYPNPGRELVNFSVRNTETSTLIIYNQLGNKVMTTSFDGKTTVSMDQIGSTGVFFYTIENSGLVSSGKLIVVE